LGRLGGYRILRLLGEGSTDRVYLAEDETPSRRVAMKVLKPEAMQDNGQRMQLLREGRAIAALKSPHVVTLYEVGVDNGVPFLVMELLEGESLDQCMQRRGKLPPDDVRRVARQTLLGLAAIHRRGWVHRDIKPANLWLEPPPPPPCEGWDRCESRVKILNLGLARQPESDPRPTQSGYMVGTLAYMAPEQARGEPVDPRADLFSLGCVLYQASTGRLPFEAPNAADTLVPLLRDQQPDLSDLILQLLQNDPGRRPRSASAALALLDDHSERHSSQWRRWWVGLAKILQIRR
jgi:urea transport system substrate-binding protein